MRRGSRIWIREFGGSPLWLAVALAALLWPVTAPGQEVPVAGESEPGGVHSHLLTPLTPDAEFPRFTPEQLAASGYPDHMHAFIWPGWEPPTDKDGLIYGVGSLCRNKKIAPRPSLVVTDTIIGYKTFELEFNAAYDPCDIMVFVEVCDMGRIMCRDLLGLEAGGKLHMYNPDNTAAFRDTSGIGTHRHFKLDGNLCILQPIPILAARTLFGHAAVSLVTHWTLEQTCGGALPAWLQHGLAAYIADEGVHLNNYMAQFRPEGPVLFLPIQTESVLSSPPHADPHHDREFFRKATYSAFLMVWELVENNGGLAPLRDFLGGVSGGESVEAACQRVYHTSLAGLEKKLDPTVLGEPIGDAVQSRRPEKQPAS